MLGTPPSEGCLLITAAGSLKEGAELETDPRPLFLFLWGRLSQGKRHSGTRAGVHLSKVSAAGFEHGDSASKCPPPPQENGWECLPGADGGRAQCQHPGAAHGLMSFALTTSSAEC